VAEVEDVRKKCLSEEEKGFGIKDSQYPIPRFPIPQSLPLAGV
jgi:hypothetical protein